MNEPCNSKSKMTNIPTKIQLHTKTRFLELAWDSDISYQLSYELLRVYSPSAEVRGHGQPILQQGKQDVVIRGLEPVGNYALKIEFDDGHDSGLYSWAYLKDLCINRDAHWQSYLEELEKHNGSRQSSNIQIHKIDQKS